MKSLNLIVLASAALFASASVPAMALDPGVGGVSVSSGSTSSGGTSISAGTGDTLGGDQQLIKLKYRTVLGNPSGYSAETIALCRLLAGR